MSEKGAIQRAAIRISLKGAILGAAAKMRPEGAIPKIERRV